MAIIRPKLKFIKGQTYIIDVSHTSNSGHPLRFTADSGTTEYTTGVTATGTPGTTGATVTFAVPENAPNDLNYYCATHGLGMGNKMKTIYDPSLSGNWYGNLGLLQYNQSVGGGSYIDRVGSVNIDTTSNATYWADLDNTTTHGNYTGACSDTVRAVWQNSGLTGSMSYFTFGSQGNATAWGTDGYNYQRMVSMFCANSNGVFGMNMGGYVRNYTDSSHPQVLTQGYQTQIVRWTMSDTNVRPAPFGDLASGNRFYQGGFNNATKSFVIGGYPAGWNNGDGLNLIDVASFATSGDATNFGNMTSSGSYGSGLGDKTTAVYSIGVRDPSDPLPRFNDDLDYISMETAGNASSFGDIGVNKVYGTGACNNDTRGLFHGGYGGSTSNNAGGSGIYYNFIRYITIQTPGNAQSFGSLPVSGYSGTYERDATSG